MTIKQPVFHGKYPAGFFCVSILFKQIMRQEGGGGEKNAHRIHGTGPGIEQANPSRDPYNGLL